MVYGDIEISIEWLSEGTAKHISRRNHIIVLHVFELKMFDKTDILEKNVPRIMVKAPISSQLLKPAEISSVF